MRAGWYERPGPANEVIKVGEMRSPTQGEGEVLVRVHASGINPSDYKRRANASVAMEFPRVIPHSDGSGVVAAVGTGVHGLREGDRVWVYSAQWRRPFGTAAEFVSLPVNQVKRLPESVSFLQGACLGIPAMTGFRAVQVAGTIRDKTVYIPGATGRVGAYALQFAKLGGAQVIVSTGSGPSSVEELKALGADVVLDRNQPDLESALLSAAGRAGVDVIIDVDIVGNIGLDERVIAENGAIISFGATNRPTLPITMSGRRARNLSFHFIFIYLLNHEQADLVCDGIVEAVSSSDITHRIAHVFPLAELARAHDSAERTPTKGHVVVEV
jgi:NADPH:quinone reductase